MFVSFNLLFEFTHLGYFHFLKTNRNLLNRCPTAFATKGLRFHVKRQTMGHYGDAPLFFGSKLLQDHPGHPRRACILGEARCKIAWHVCRPMCFEENYHLGHSINAWGEVSRI